MVKSETRDDQLSAELLMSPCFREQSGVAGELNVMAPFFLALLRSAAHRQLCRWTG